MRGCLDGDTCARARVACSTGAARRPPATPTLPESGLGAPRPPSPASASTGTQLQTRPTKLGKRLGR
ncbi:hypothetical protein B5X24_HaOG207722 [Helicoverpa armigera]|uniref:Uncharacterized protein n=1 Tax=Helicoverpa armigera TaxID=29058 RepID=A0A2W1BJM3_HELAM|nr:hypothetical protein B5X24_HaOG207722 [Helicoverpa armigera]